ncbi:MAG TPA: ubiquinol-cytochrome c reductase cytochrome b subunit [Acidimicrobiales bacterium]|nr:ubiquinol-cytochrome c reductase cytochrome b subunit [Acidimicrobiales bacterium]
MNTDGGRPSAPSGHRGTPLTRRTVRWLDRRVGAAGMARKALEKVFPDHWSFLIGEIALWSFVMLLLTGVYLTFFFEPSLEKVVYDGSYEGLRGLEITRAYDSALDISFEVRSGLVMRQMHHWAALVFVASTSAHLCRVFFTGAFRRPRELNWIIGVTLMILAIVNGFTGYSLLDDQLSGTGLRIAYNIAISIPLVGTWIASLFFGGEFPGPDIITRLYVIHILLVPGVLLALIGLHMGLLVRQRHTQFSGPGRTEDNVVGERVWPTYLAKGLGMFFLTSAALAALGGLAQINPIWLYGPYEPADVSTASQPDWYMGWLDGALRIMPSWEFRAFGFEVPNPFLQAVLVPTITFLLLFLWPFLEARVTKDHAEHHLLDRPRDRPVRTALGVAALSFYTVLFFAGGSDVLAVTFGIPINVLFPAFQVLLVVLPAAAGYLAYRLCKELAQRDQPGGEHHAREVAPPAPDSGESHRREVAPDDTPERQPAAEAGGKPRR